MSQWTQFGPRNVNGQSQQAGKGWQLRHTLGLGLMLFTSVSAVACGGSIKRELIYEKKIELPAGRFVGPVTIDMPRRPEGSLRDTEYLVVLETPCGPRLRLGYPDGESKSIGSSNARWQQLLRQRAEHKPTDAEEAPAQEAAEDAAPKSAGPGAAPVYTSGTWQRTTVESWPGQLEFQARRDTRCATTKTYRKRYITAYDEDGKFKIWAEVPQELGAARLWIRVYDRVDVEREERVARRERRRQKRRERLEARAELDARVSIEVKPRPPKPTKPKKEKPGKAEAEGATWTPGYWSYSEGKGKWIWVRGQWAPPSAMPALKAEDHGAPPIAGCTWQAGYWVWIPGRGAWKWHEGHWNAPPPKVEERGEPPVPESPWVDGRWVRAGVSFKWIAGRWGRPVPRKETIPAPPYQGARWHAGAWMKLRGKWTWSPGFYEKSRMAPPPVKEETPGASPAAGAVWLGGFWRWQGQRYSWVPGHWELPPGDGYVWVPDPPDPQTGYSVSGQWKLDVDIQVPVEVRP